jgi:hypothetical protein
MIKCLQRIIILFIVIHSSSSIAFDNRDTHPNLSSIAADKSLLNDILKNELFIKNYKEILNGPGGEPKKIIEWIEQGSENEDDPTCRAASHFHNPLRPWDKAGLTNNLLAIDAWCAATNPEFSEKYSNLTCEK